MVFSSPKIGSILDRFKIEALQKTFESLKSKKKLKHKMIKNKYQIYQIRKNV